MQIKPPPILTKLGLYKLAGLALLLFYLFTTPAQATPGLTTLSSNADSTTGQYQTRIEDIKVKVQGGYVRIVRTYENGKWHWNKRWNPIALYGIIDPTSELAQNLNHSTIKNDQLANLPFAVVRNEAAYLWTLSPTHINQLKLTDRRYQLGNNKTFTITDNGQSYSWHDKKGNTIRYAGPIVDADENERGYAPTLQIADYSDKNGNTVTFNRNGQGDIDTISVAGQTILTYSYNAGRIQFITDYSGRRVEYHYTDSLLTSVRDVRGEVWHYTYNETQQLTGYTDPEGFATRQTVDANGILQSQQNDNNNNNNSQAFISSYVKSSDQYYRKQTDAVGKITERWTNAIGQTVRLDINGETRYTVDIILNDNSINVRKLHRNDFIKRGSHSSYSRYPAMQNMPAALHQQQHLYIKTRIRTDAQGDKTRTDYDRYGNIIKIIYPDGGTETRRYHSHYNLPTKVIDETGIITEYSYDEKGNLTQIIDAKGLPEQRTVQHQYDEHGNQIEITQLGDNNTEQSRQTFSYDNYGNKQSQTDGEGKLTQYTGYDPLGNINTLIDGRGNTWLSSYDKVGNMLSQSDPDGRTTQYQYNKTGQRIKTIAADGTETTLRYHNKQLSQIIQPSVKGTPDANSPAGYATTFSYDDAGRLISTTDASGHSNQTKYDKAGRIAQQIDGNHNITRYDYKDNQLSQIHYPTFSESYHYNNRNDRTSTIIDADGQLRQRKAFNDRDARTLSQTDANNNQTIQQHDIFGRLIKTTDAELAEIHYRYDNRNNLIEVIDGEGRSTMFTYDKNNRLTSEIKQANNETIHYAYDETGNLKTIISPAQHKTAFRYSDAGLLLETKHYTHQHDTNPEKTTTYTYNSNGQLESYNDSNTQASYHYNARNQLIQATQDFGSFTKSYHYSYTPNGQKQSYTNPEGIEYTYHYDNNGQLQQIDIPDEGALRYQDYQWTVPRQITYPQGTKQQLGYDDTLRRVSQIYQDRVQQDQHTATLSYDNENNIIQQTKRHAALYPAGSTDYGYDKNYRLTDVDTTEKRADFPLPIDEQYSYDKVANRITSHNTTQDWTYNDNNQLIQADTITYSYDVNGNRITKTDTTTNQTTRYSYNSEQRLIKIEQENTLTQQTTTLAEYQYDPFGRRISKTKNNHTTYYLYSQEGLMAEYDETGTLKTEYHYQPNSTWMTNPLFMRTDSNQQNTTQILYYYNDHLGTPQALHDKGGQLRWLANYSAFGEAHIQPLQQAQYQVTQNLRFPGQYYDEESGLHQNYFRDYEPTTGRYIQADPIGLAGGVNTYAYVTGNPLKHIDPEALSVLNPYLPCAGLGCLPIKWPDWMANPQPQKELAACRIRCGIDVVNPFPEMFLEKLLEGKFGELAKSIGKKVTKVTTTVDFSVCMDQCKENYPEECDE